MLEVDGLPIKKTDRIQIANMLQIKPKDNDRIISKYMEFKFNNLHPSKAGS